MIFLVHLFMDHAMPGLLTLAAGDVMFARPSPQPQLFDKVDLRQYAACHDPFLKKRTHNPTSPDGEYESISVRGASARMFPKFSRSFFLTRRFPRNILLPSAPSAGGMGMVGSRFPRVGCLPQKLPPGRTFSYSRYETCQEDSSRPPGVFPAGADCLIFLVAAVGPGDYKAISTILSRGQFPVGAKEDG